MPRVFAARAMLMRADILLLDEPTNHLDVANVAWLENYLVNRPEISSVSVMLFDETNTDHRWVH